MVRKALALLLLMLLLVGCTPAPFSAYKDGTYIGEAEGKRRHLKVEITIENSRLTSCRVIEHYEGAYYAKDAVIVVPERILEQQSSQVDVFTGSSLTSRGIMDAVEDALEKAKK